MSNLKISLIGAIFKLKPALKNEMGQDLCGRIMNKMKDDFKERDKRKPKEKGIMRFHRMFLIMGLSLYHALHDESVEKDDLVEIIHRIIWEGRTRKLTEILAYFIRCSEDPYNLYLKLLGPKNERFFPCPPWEKIEVELENGTGWHQKMCPYYDFFKDEGVAELTKAYCDLDNRIAELVPDYIALKRERTLAKGDNWCEFYYYQT